VIESLVELVGIEPTIQIVLGEKFAVDISGQFLTGSRRHVAQA
jgi:hypothetical protein